MYDFEPNVSIQLEFRAMTAPATVSVPGYILRYLDMNAERTFTPDGNVLYRYPSNPANLPELGRFLHRGQAAAA